MNLNIIMIISMAIIKLWWSTSKKTSYQLHHRKCHKRHQNQWRIIIINTSIQLWLFPWPSLIHDDQQKIFNAIMIISMTIIINSWSKSKKTSTLSASTLSPKMSPTVSTPTMKTSPNASSGQSCFGTAATMGYPILWRNVHRTTWHTVRTPSEALPMVCTLKENIDISAKI